MNAVRKLEADEWEAALADLREGTPTCVVAGDLGLSVQALQSRLGREGYSIRELRGSAEQTPWDEDMVWLLTQMHARAMSYTAIASALSVVLGFEVGPSQVTYQLKRRGLKSLNKPRGVPYGSPGRLSVAG